MYIKLNSLATNQFDSSSFDYKGEKKARSHVHAYTLMDRIARPPQMIKTRKKILNIKITTTTLHKYMLIISYNLDAAELGFALCVPHFTSFLVLTGIAYGCCVGWLTGSMDANRNK